MTLSESVRVLLPPEMPKSNIVVKELSSGFQATWGNPVAVKVKVSYAEAAMLGWTPGDVLQARQPSLGTVPLKLATRLVQKVHAYVTAQPSAQPVEIYENGPGEGISNDPMHSSTPEPPDASDRRLIPAPAMTLTDAEVDTINNARHPRPDTSMGWLARQVATFPTFVATIQDGIYEHEREALRSWAFKQDPKSGRGQMILNLLEADTAANRVLDQLSGVADSIDDVASDLETLVEKITENKLGDQSIVDPLKKYIAKLEAAATEARK